MPPYSEPGDEATHFRALNLYARLGISERATQEEIRRAHKHLLKRLHPDLNSEGGDAQRARYEDMMKAANEARDTLLDPDRRAYYDLRRLGHLGNLGHVGQSRRSRSSGKTRSRHSPEAGNRRQRDRRSQPYPSQDSSPGGEPDLPSPRPRDIPDSVYRLAARILGLLRRRK